MAITFTHRATLKSTSNITGPYTAAPTWTPAANSLLLAWIHHSGDSSDANSVTGHGLTYTQIARVNMGASGASGTTELWAALAGASPTNVAVSASWAVAQTGASVDEVEVTGYDTSLALATPGPTSIFQQAPSAGNSGTAATSGSVTLAAASNPDNRPSAVFAHAANAIETTPRTNWTEGQDGSWNTPVRAVEYQYRTDAFETTASATWTTSSIWSAIAVEIAAPIQIEVLIALDINSTAAPRITAFLEDFDEEPYDYYAQRQDGMVEAIVDEAVPPFITEYNTTRSTGRSLEGGSGVGINEAQAQGVTLARTSLVSTIWMWLDANASPADTVVLDVVSSLTGSAIASASVPAASVPSVGAGGGLVVFSFTPFSLEGGVLYFLRLTRSGARDTVNDYDVEGQSSPLPPQAAWTRGTGVWSTVSLGYEYHVFGSQQGAAPSWIAPPPVEQDTAYQADPDEEHFNWYAQKLDGSVETFIAGAPAGGGGPSDAELVAADPNYNGLGRISAFLDDEDAEAYDYYAAPPAVDSSFIVAPRMQAWIDFGTPSLLFTDTGRTTPVASAGDLIRGVTDKSGNGQHLTQATNPPTYQPNAYRGLSTSRWDGAAMKLQGPVTNSGVGYPQPITRIAVVRSTEVSATSRVAIGGQTATDPAGPWTFTGLWSAWAGSTTLSDGAQDNALHVITTVFNGASSSIALEGIVKVTGTTGSGVVTRYEVGSYNDGTQLWLGDVCEFIDFQGILDPADLAFWTNYMVTRWSVLTEVEFTPDQYPYEPEPEHDYYSPLYDGAADAFIAGPPVVASDAYIAALDLPDHTDQPDEDEAWDFYDPFIDGAEAVLGFLVVEDEIANAAQLDAAAGQDDDALWPLTDPTDIAPFIEQAEAIVGFLTVEDEIAEAAQLDRSVGQDDDQAWVATDPTDVWPFTDQGEAFIAGPPASDDFIATLAPHVESVAVDFPERIDDTEEQAVEAVHIQPEEYIAGSTVADDPLYLAQTYVEQDVEGLFPPEWFVEADAAALPTTDISAHVFPFFDSFNRADNPLVLGTADSGQIWPAPLNGVWGILSNQAYLASGSGQVTAIMPTGTVDQDVTVQIVHGGTQNAGFYFACKSPTSQEVLYFNIASATSVVLYKTVDESTYTPLAGPVTIPSVAGTTATYRVTFDHTTGSIAMFVNGVQVIAFTLSPADLAVYGDGKHDGVGLHKFAADTAFTYDSINVAQLSPDTESSAVQTLADQASFPEQETEDYANDTALDATAPTFFPPAVADDYIATTALVPDASDQPAPDEAWDGWAYPVEASEWFIGFLAPDAEVADAAQDHTVGQDDDQLWTLTDPTDAAPFLDGIEYLTGFLVPSDEIAQAAQPHYGDWQDWREAEQTEDYANDSTIGVEAATPAPDAFDVTAAIQLAVDVGQDWHLWPEWDYTDDQPYASELDVSALTFPADPDEVTQAAQPTAIGQDDDQLWTLVDPTDIASFTEQAEGFVAGPPDAFDTTIATQLATDVGQDLDLLFPPDLSQLDTGYVEQAEGYVAGPPAFAPDAETIASQPAETGIDVEGRWPEWDGTDAAPFLDGAEWLIGFTVPDVEITIAAQPSRAEDTAVDNPDRIEWTEETDPATTLDLSPLVRPDDPIEVTYAAQLDASVGQDDDQWWTLLDPTDVTPFLDEQEELIAGSTTADDPIYAAQTWPDLATTEYAPEETTDYANDTAVDLSALTPAPDSTDTTFAAQLDPSVGQDDDQSWIAADPTDIWPFTDQLEAFEEIVLPDEGIAATQDYSDNQYEPEALWAPDSLADGSIEVLASLSDQATLAAAGALSEPASEPEDEAWPIYLALPDQSGEFAATQLDIALVAALDLTPAPIEEPEAWTPEVALADGVEQVALTAEAAVTVAAQPTFDAYDWTTFEEPVADLTTIERRPTPLQPTARPEIIGMTALADPGVDLVALKDPEVGFPQGGGFSSGFSSGFARGGGSGELDALAESEGYAMGPYGAPVPDHVSALEGEVEQIDALSDPDVDVT